MIFEFTDGGRAERRLKELAENMPQSEWKKCDPHKTIAESNYEGLRAQFGFCRLLGIPFDWELKPGGDGGIDFILSGRPGQMKYNNYRPPVGELYFRKSQYWAPRVQFSILAVPTKDIVDERGKATRLGKIEFVGWTGRARFEKLSRDHVWPGKCRVPVRTMKAEDLKPLQELLQFLFPMRYASPNDFKQEKLWTSSTLPPV